MKLTLPATKLLTPKILLLLGGIIALNVTSNPNAQNLELVGHLTTPARSFYLQGDYVYLAAGEEGLKIVDVSDPSAPTLVGTYEISGSMEDVAVTGSVAAALDDVGDVLLLDVSTPAAPVELGRYTPPEKGYRVVLADNYLYVPAMDSGLRIVDISTPYAPVEVGVYPAGYASSVAVGGDYAYLLAGGTLRIINVADPGAPTALRAYGPVGGWLAGVNVVGERLYLTLGVGTDWTYVTIFDLSDPTALVPIEPERDLPLNVLEVRGSSLALAATDDKVYLVPPWRGLRMIDISNPARPVETGFYNQNFASARVIATDDYVYVSDRENGLYIFEPHPVDIPEPGLTVDLAGHFGGGTNPVFVGETYAYVGFGPELAILDIADPSAPRRIGYLVLAGGDGNAVEAITVVGPYAYVADTYGLWVVDVSDPTQPFGVGHTLIRGGVNTDVTVAGQYAYLTQWYNSGQSGSGNVGHGYFKVVDVSDPAHPYEVSTFKTSNGGSRNRGARAAQVIDNHAYVADSEDYGLRVFDVSDPAEPIDVEVSSGGAEDFVLRDGYAYTTNGSQGGFRVFDVSDPTALKGIGFYETPGRTGDVALVDDYAYFVEDPPLVDFQPVGDYGLRILDVSNPISPTAAGTYTTTTAIADLSVKDHYAYLSSQGALRILDLADRTNPVEIGVYQTLPPSVSEMSVADDWAYVVTGDDREGRAVQVLNISNPAEPVMVQPSATELGPATPVLDGYAYLIEDGDLRILDASNPVTLTQAGAYSTSLPIHRLVTRENYAYAVLDGGYGSNWQLGVLDLSDPTAPLQANSVDLLPDLQEVHLEMMADHLYLVSAATGLRVFDVSEPPNLVEVDTGLDISGKHMALRDGHAYVAGQGLHILDASDPARSVMVGAAQVGLSGTRWSIADIAVDEGYTYLLDDVVGLRVIDISDPSAPVEVGFAPIPGAPTDLAVADDHIWVATERSGLFLYQLTPAGETSPSPNILQPVPPATPEPVLTPIELATPSPDE